MPTYLYLCPECGEREARTATTETQCPACGASMRRDWKGEAVGVAIQNLKQAREAGR